MPLPITERDRFRLAHSLTHSLTHRPLRAGEAL